MLVSALLRYSPIELIFFYNTPHHQNQVLDQVLPNLKQSLSLTLKHFLPLAGTLTWPSSSPNPIINYKQGDGVFLTVSVSDADFDHLTSKNNRDCKDFRPLVASIVASDSVAPGCAVRISVFPDKGFSIAVTVHHVFFDGKSMALFIRSWASISKSGESGGGLVPDMTPVFDREPVREQYRSLTGYYIELLKRNGVGPNKLAIPEREPLPDTVRGTFELSNLDITKLKEHVRARLVEKYRYSQVPYVSTFTAAYAYVIHCLVKAKGSKIISLRVAIPYDCRGRLNPPLAENYIGNCVGILAQYFDMFETDLMIVVANFIIESMNSLGKNGAVRGAEDWLPPNRDTVRIYAAGSFKFRFQDIDFGWGKPRKADQTLIDGTCGVTFSERDGGGIEIELSLVRAEMENFTSVFARGVEELVRSRSAAL